MARQFGARTQYQTKESAWVFKVVDTIEGRVKCTKRCVQIARKSAKFLLSPEEIVQFTAKNVIQNEKIAAVKKAPFFPGQWPGNKPFAFDTL